MPQLNPSPWLTTMIMAWLTLLLMKPLLLPLTPTSLPNQIYASYTSTPWPWTWQ